MGVPNFLASTFRYKILSPCTNVSQIIAALNDELVVNGNWTDEGGLGTGPFKSPVNALDLSYMTITLTVVSATRLRWVCNDSGLYLINNQTSTCQDIDATGTVVHIVASDDLVVVDSNRATPECFWICRLKVWPDVSGRVPSLFACSQGPRNNAGTFGNNYVTSKFIRDETGTSYSPSAYMLLARPYGDYAKGFSVSGGIMCWPVEFCNHNTGVLLGRIPLVVMTDDSFLAGAVINVPIGDGTVKPFRVIGLAGNSSRKLAVRTG